MQPRLILHIGTEKTGTTALQHWLRDQREQLARFGVGLPSTLGPTNHRRLPTSCFDPDRVDDFVIRSGLATDQQLRMATYRRWQADFARETLASEYPTWLVSSEHLSSRLTRGCELARLQSLLAALGRSVEVILYIRDPLQTAISAWSTLVINGGFPLESLPKPSDRLLVSKCNHRLLIKRWSHWFPSLQVRLYSSNLLSDFLAAIGLPTAAMASLQHTLPVRNPAVPYQAILAIARLNRDLPVYVGSALNPDREQRIAEILEETRGLPVYSPNPADQAAYAEYYAASNDWVCRNYFVGQSRLFG